MNLADAIRKASLQGGAAVHSAQEPLFNGAAPNAEATLADEASFSPAEVEDTNTVALFGDDVRMPDPPAPVVAGGSVVRLELFLAPEQLHSLFKTVVATQHSVMTLREAASFLRIAPTVLEQMAVDHEVPAFQVDGKWRFSKASIDEWLNLKLNEKEAS